MTRVSGAVGRMRGSAFGVTAGLIGWFVVVEFASGILQGFYIPLFPDIVAHLGIRDADVNWFEAAQLLLSALVLPILAKLGDMFGHKRILLFSALATAAASWGLVFADSFTAFLVMWALQGFYVVWLPLEIALVFDRGRRARRGVSGTRRAAGLLVVGLQIGGIVGALAAGRLFAATGGDLRITLMGPAIAVTLVSLVIWLGVPESESTPGRRLDIGGFVILAGALLCITGALSFLRLPDGPGPLAVGALLLIGAALVAVFIRHELRQSDPAVDVRAFARPEMWPIQTTAFLVGISLLGAQGPLATYAGTDPARGYGLGLDATERSNVIGVYLLSVILGAVLFAVGSRLLRPRVVLIVASVLVGLGYGLFLPFHTEVWQVLACLCVAGLGSGALIGALPAAAAAAAVRGQTGVASALTNTTKTVGGTMSSAVFGVVLAGGAGAVVAETAAPLAGYMTVWTICAVGGFVAAVLLLFVPKVAFADSAEEEAEAGAGRGTVG